MSFPVLLAGDYPIIAETMTIELGPTSYTVTEPVVTATLRGVATDMNWTYTVAAVGGLGNVYTQINFTFPAGAVGKRISLIVYGTKAAP